MGNCIKNPPEYVYVRQLLSQHRHRQPELLFTLVLADALNERWGTSVAALIFSLKSLVIFFKKALKETQWLPVLRGWEPSMAEREQQSKPVWSSAF